MAKPVKPTPERIHELFYLDEAGVPRWRNVSGSHGRYPADREVVSRPAGRDKAYLYANVDGYSLPLHVLVFVLHRGFYAVMVDHDDRNKRNNHPSNLVSSQASENQLNRLATQVSNTGVKGVFLRKNGTFKVQRRKGGVIKYGGTFPTLEQATEVAEGLFP